MSNGTGDLITRVYSNFRGVDFRGEECDLTRSPDAVNMWKDYKSINSIQSRPDWETLRSAGVTIDLDTVYGIYFYKDKMLVHHGMKLSEVHEGNVTLLYGGTYGGLSETANAGGFVYGDEFFFLNRSGYFRYDGTTFAEVEGYVPTTSIGRKPSGGGTTYEDVNMLTGWRINTFVGDGESVDFHLDATGISEAYDITVTVNGEDTVDPTASIIGKYSWEVDKENGVVTFRNAPPKPDTEGQDNVTIKFYKTVSGYQDRIRKCTLLQVFDNRVFVSGNEDYPNMVWHSALNDPTYFSDLDYYQEGLDEAKIKAIVAGNNALWVFREPSDANTNIFYHTPTIDSEYGKIYPSTHSSIALGCKGKAINFNDDIVFFSPRGMEGISGDVTTEQVVAHRSSLIDRKLLAEEDYENMVLVEWEGYLLVCIWNYVYLADSRGKFTHNDHFEYEWFYWDLGELLVKCAAVHDGILYLGTNVGIFTLTGYDAPLDLCYWTTPKDKFKYPHMLKTTSKKSCTVEAKGEEIYVSAKTNNDENYQHLGNFEKVTDAFNCRIKKKKFKDIQLRFAGERFTLESATLECYIGGYLKNL